LILRLSKKSKISGKLKCLIEMLYATVNGQKVEAQPELKGLCPLCERPVYSKCGEINVWHWAHYVDENCDSWYEQESEWHKNWKLVFGKENSEIIITKDGIKHIADILTNDNIVIELQNSPIQKPIIRKRENFYGERMIWIINGKHFKDNFRITSFISRLDEDEEYARRNNPLLRGFGYGKKGYEGNEYQAPKDVFFNWDWARKSWNDVQRNVFIDFGDEKLFWVKSGMGSKEGKGRQKSKEAFITKYGGDIELLANLIDNH
jgi:hypothetical protein